MIDKNCGGYLVMLCIKLSQIACSQLDQWLTSFLAQSNIIYYYVAMKHLL